MQQALRPYATAGVAIVGASLIGITPIGAPLRDMGTFRDVALTSGGSDLLTPWIDQFNTASENATTLLNTFAEAPFVGAQQALANLSDYTQQLLDDPANISNVTVQFQDDLAAVLQAFALQGQVGSLGYDKSTIAVTTLHTLLGDPSSLLNGHLGLLENIGSFIPAGIPSSDVLPIIDFLASPMSGYIMGDLGPFISPLVALDNSIAAGDGLNETLANMAGAFFNGATLSLNDLIPLVDQLNFFPQGMNMENLEIAFGGLLTPGDVGAQGGGVGGSILNSLGITLTGVPTIGSIDLSGVPVGPLAAWEGWDQAIASLLGWDGSGPPLADVTLPTIAADLLNGGSTTAASELSTLVNDVIAAF